MISIKYKPAKIKKNKVEVPKKIRSDSGKLMKTVAWIIQNRLHENTPVYEGRAIANFQWSENSPFVGEVEPVGDYPPGRTSQMSLGEEPRRDDNRAISDASLAAIKFTKNTKLFLTNNVPYMAELEYGQAPTPGGSRTPPTGIFRAALAEAKAYLVSKRKGAVKIIVRY